MKRSNKRLGLISWILLIGVGAEASASSANARSKPDQEILDRDLRQAAMSGVISQLRELIQEGANVNGRAPHGESALEYAIRFGQTRAATQLLRWGANPNSEDDSGRTPLERAAQDCNGSRILDALLKAGARVNHQDLYGQTALMKAVQADCARSVAVILLRAKDTVNLSLEDDAQETAEDLAQNGLVPQMLDLAKNYQQGARQALDDLRRLQ